MRLLLAAFFIEAGFVLIVAPWSAFWTENYFLRFRVVESIAMSAYVRGAISGIGVLNVAAAVAELYGFLAERRAHDRVPSITHAPAAEE